MTLGTPCIASDATGIPEIVVDGHTGVQTRQGDAESLSKAIEKVLSDEVLRVRLALKARVLVESEFSAHRNASQLRAGFTESPSTGKSKASAKTNGKASDEDKFEIVTAAEEMANEMQSISL